jgi:hypothetical protein
MVKSKPGRRIVPLYSAFSPLYGLTNKLVAFQTTKHIDSVLGEVTAIPFYLREVALSVQEGGHVS